MRFSVSWAGGLTAVVLLLAGCASIVSDSTYPVNINSNIPGAKIVITDTRGNIVFNGTTPATVALKAGAGFFKRGCYDVAVSLPGYQSGRTTIRAELDGWYIGNIIFGGLIGILIVDPLTGAMWKINSPVTVAVGAPLAGNAASFSTSEAEVSDLQLQVMSLAEVPEEMRGDLVRIQ